jgi:hypothetical protein
MLLLYHLPRAFYERLGGVVVSEKEDVRPTAPLTEVAYGWRDVAGLRS